MRKLLMGSTAVAAAALFAPGGALAQGADPFQPAGPPMVSHRLLEVRVGGYFRGYYGYASQSSQTERDAAGTTRIGNSDFLQETEIHIVANGKAANGLRYGAAIELQNDSINQTLTVAGSTGSAASKNTIDIDEAWGFIAGPFGQLRFGDEDNVYGLMAQGHITNFASGGVDGDFYDVLVGAARPNFNMTSDAGDNTKLIYMSPQFFGFDAGVSFAFNTGEADREGCVAASTACDRLSATTGANFRRRNEITAMLRWRGSFGGVGLGAHVGYFGADPIKNSTGVSPERINILLGGVQATAFGLTVGGHVTYGAARENFFTPRLPDRIGARQDDRNLLSIAVGASYTIDAITVGAQYVNARSAGNQTITTGARREQGLNVGATYRIAPGIEAIAEYTYVLRKESGFDFISGGTGALNNRIRADVVLAGFRFAF
ncbi:porin [Roseomonas sp. CCTCC AB2023176]|uniref:porin n=1 Tax=Roseomonas sp. CCTCC AB2023176 TaxID=3342640 RepID=UPI0035E19280